MTIDNNQVESLYDIHKKNMESIGGLAKQKSFFELLPKYFLPEKDYNIYIARKEGSLIAALLLFYFNETVEYFTPTIVEQYRTLQPLSIIIINAAEQAAIRNYKWWNWGGTWDTQTGVYRFKKKWAALENKYYYYTQVNDDSILRCTPKEILERYPSFYIIPFNELKEKH